MKSHSPDLACILRNQSYEIKKSVPKYYKFSEANGRFKNKHAQSVLRYISPK